MDTFQTRASHIITGLHIPFLYIVPCMNILLLYCYSALRLCPVTDLGEWINYNSFVILRLGFFTLIIHEPNSATLNPKDIS